MADYKRLVSYIYSYEYGRKNNNVGFVKLDSRNNMCKITLNFRLQHAPIIHPLKVYLFVRNGQKIIGILLGMGNITGTTYDFRDIVNPANVKESGYSLEEISGVYIGDGTNRSALYATAWDDMPLNPNMFFVHNKEKANTVTAINTKTENKDEDTLRVDDSIVKLVKDYVEMNEEQKTDDNANNEVRGVKIENDHEYENKTMDVKEHKDSIWDRLYSKHTKIVGIKNNNDIECIKIKPQDLACLPNKYWVLGNNSFLLHGYYNYRYLLFAKVKNDGQDVQQYKLGVPGIFHRNEKIMASMFGFNEFLEADQLTGKGETFGYWCMDIQINI